MLWFDATTILRLQAHAPVGLTRIEAHVLSSALELPANQTGFCVFNRYTHAMEEIPREKVNKLVSHYGESSERGHGAQIASKSTLSVLFRKLETRVRLTYRKARGKLRALSQPDLVGERFQRGDVLILSGGTWDALDTSILLALARRGIQTVAILSDMIPCRYPHHFQHQSPIESFERVVEFLVREAALVVCISEATRADFATFAASKGHKLPPCEVMHLGSETPHTDQQAPPNLPHDFLERGFTLSVSTLQVRKNHQLLYQLWRRFAEEGRHDIPRLVLVGTPGWLTDNLRKQWEADPLLQDSLIALPSVDDRELSWLYQNARFTLYPSLYEGWGLPIVESFQHGTPCIASNTSSMPEAGQGLALHLDPLDFISWHKAILDWCEDDGALIAAKAHIHARFRPRTWSQFSSEFIARVQQLTAESSYRRAA